MAALRAVKIVKYYLSGPMRKLMKYRYKSPAELADEEERTKRQGVMDPYLAREKIIVIDD